MKEANTLCKQIQPLSRIKTLALLGFFRRTGFCSPPHYCNWPHYPGARLLVYLPRPNGPLPNRFRAGKGPRLANLRGRDVSKSAVSRCSHAPTMNDIIVNLCQLRKFEDNARSWRKTEAHAQRYKRSCYALIQVSTAMGIVRNNIYSYEVRPIPVYQFLIRISDQKFFSFLRHKTQTH